MPLMAESAVSASKTAEKSAVSNARLIQIDALRGVAAVLVVFFHFTTQYDRLFGHVAAPPFSVPWGHYGVNLFFMISGFVIFMTLHRINRPFDFVVSRFSRLFPAYWVAIPLTFAFTHYFQVPGKMVSVGTALLNLPMIHGLFRVEHVDGVYWTLEVELLFYAWALLLYRIGRLDRVHSALFLLMFLRLAYFLADRMFGVEFSYTLSRLLILPYIAWFICGIVIYRRTRLGDPTPRLDTLTLLLAIALLGVVDGPNIAVLAAVLSGVLFAAAKGRLLLLTTPVLGWLGAISYTLYLVHENIGWGIIRYCQIRGMGVLSSILVALVAVLVLATLLSRWVEQPGLAWLRNRYRQCSKRGAPAHL